MYPNYKDKWKHKTLVAPTDYIKFQRLHGRVNHKVPLKIILYFQTFLGSMITKEHNTSQAGNIIIIEKNGEQIGIKYVGVGAPNLAIQLEELYSLGAREFVSLGFAGALSKKLTIGDLVICNKAIRDEGTSYHYIKPKKYSVADKALTRQIEAHFTASKEKFFKGLGWTVDAPYRETFNEVKKYQKEGVLTVDMEASMLFAFGEYYKCKTAATFVISDSLAKLKWEPQFYSVKNELLKLFNLLLSAI